MLRELHVSDLGVIEDADVRFDAGLNVLTGETGAGKTMITVALALALGRRASAALVREGAGAARVQARFDAITAAEEGGWAEDGSLVLARTIEADGRSSARAGGQIAPASVLERLGRDLVEMHGQHESTLLRSAAAQTSFVDRFAGPEHVRSVEALAAAFAHAAEVSAALDELVRTERDREREADVLAFQIAEIEKMSPRPGELAGLEAEALRLANVERLLTRVGEAEASLAPDGGAADGLSVGAAALEDAAALDAAAAELAARARSLAEEAAELARDVRHHREGLEDDPARLDAVNERIAAIRSLLRKYGDTEEAVIGFVTAARERRAVLGEGGERREHLERDVARLRADVVRRSADVSAGRRAAAPRLAAAVEAELQALGMASATLSIELVPVPPGPSGTERAEFRFAAGARQRPLPLAKVASGGELSRTLLACRTVLVDADAAPTLVFDEVDAGIGGAAAAAVGRRLASLARDRQVVVVTHLPQIAAFADRHVAVRKDAGVATAHAVEGPERIAELSRMLAGLPESDTAAAHAEELLAEAGRLKAS